jgi:tRNA dimethylallyltransferase
MGPTGSGKTQLAVNLVRDFPFEIISVDSAMVYRGMDIGTAKPEAEILNKAPHRLIDIRDPADAYSAAHFRDDALREIKDIMSHGKIPLLVGGTMLYFSALQNGLSELPSADPEMRAKLTAEAEKHGWAFLHARLSNVDSIAGARIHPNDTQRIQRALEVYELTGRSLTDWQQEDAPALAQYEICSLALTPLDRVTLHERIEQRFSMMLDQGFLDEVKKLFARGDLNLDMPSMRSVGYRQAWDYLSGNSTDEEMRAKAVIATRQLAKRQLTWLRNWPQEIQWFDSMSQDLYAKVLAFIKLNVN